MRPSVVSTIRNIGITQVACGVLHSIILADKGILGRYNKDVTAYVAIDVEGLHIHPV